MDKLILIIGDKDQDYLNLVANFIRHSAFNQKFLLKYFSNKQHFNEFLNSDDRLDILLATPDMLQDMSRTKQTITILLKDTVDHVISDETPFIAKFQPLDQLFNTIIQIFSEKNHDASLKLVGNKKTKVLSFFSAIGGIGKTTLAMNIAKQLAIRNEKVFYLNMEYLSSSELYFPTDRENSFSDLLFYLEANPMQLQAKIGLFKKKDHNLDIDFFEPTDNIQEMQNITRDQTELILHTLIEMQEYDYIIVDLSSSSEDRIIVSLENSDEIYWLLLDDIQSIHKTKKLLLYYHNLFGKEYDFLHKKIKFIVNKSLGNGFAHELDTSIKIHEFLPYIPSWKAITSIDQLINEKAFTDKVIKLVNSFNYKEVLS